MLKKIPAISLIAAFLFPGLLFAQQIPQYFKENVPEDDLLDVFCLMSKWKTGEFFAAIDSLDEILVPALRESKEFGANPDIPDMTAYRNQAEVKLNAICSAKTYEEAENSLSDFIAFAESLRDELNNLNSGLKEELMAEGERIRQRVETEVKAEIDAWAEQERVRLEAEIMGKADHLGSQLQSNLEREVAGKGFTSGEEAMAWAESRKNQLMGQMDSELQAFVEAKKQEMEQLVEQKKEEFMGEDAKKFKELGETFSDIESKIETSINKKKSGYETYKDQAMEKRSEIIVSIIEKQMQEAEARIMEKEGLLLEAKLNNPSVKTAAEYIAELNQDKEELVSKIQVAIDAESESIIEEAIKEMKDKWNQLRENLEKDMVNRKTAKDVCQLALSQALKAKPEIEGGLKQILKAETEIRERSKECDLNPENELCKKVNSILGQLTQTRERAEDIIKNINSADSECGQATEETPATAVADLLLSIKYDGLKFQEEVSVLKSEWVKDKEEIERALNELNK